MKRLMMTLALVLAFPLAASAQQHGQMHQQRGMQQGMGMPMMGGMHGMMMARPGPGMLLRLERTLELTDQQVQELEGMHAEAHEAMKMHREAAREARRRAHEAMMGESADLDAFQDALEEAAQHNVQAMVAMARVHAQAAGVLTDEQTMKLHTLMQAMQEMREGRGMEGPGMGEGMHGEGMHRGEHQGMRSGG